MRKLLLATLLVVLGLQTQAQDCVSGDCINGFGTEKSTEFSYTGNFSEGLKHGNGKRVWDSGSTYDGDWKFDKQHGNGKIVWADGGSYEGGWKYNQRHGNGKYVWADGASYEGDYKFGEKHGKGKQIWADGSSYEGDWKFGKKHGKGKHIWANGDIYEGDWKVGKLHGKGEYVWPSGSSYEGDWKFGKRTGLGKNFNDYGSLKNQGIWHNSNFISNNTGCLKGNDNCVKDRLCCDIKKMDRETFFINGMKILVDLEEHPNFLSKNPEARKRFFYSDEWELTSEENAIYYRIYSDFDSINKTYLIQDFYYKNHQLQWEGWGENDNPTATDTENIFCEGKTTFYDQDGTILRITNYHDGLLHGEKIYFYKNRDKFILNYKRGVLIE